MNNNDFYDNISNDDMCMCPISFMSKKIVKKHKLKHDNQFQKTHGFYRLPCQLDSSRFSSENRSRLKTNYNAFKKLCISHHVSLNDIFLLPNISDKDRFDLTQLYSMANHYQINNDFVSYIVVCDKLYQKYVFLKNIPKDLAKSRIEFEKKRKYCIDNFVSNDDKLMQKIINLNVDEFVLSTIIKKFDELHKSDPSFESFHKIKNWLDIATSLPYKYSLPLVISDTKAKYLLHIKQQLDLKLYGMKEAKEKLLLILNNMLSGVSVNHCICLCGPPGAGKTQLIRTYANIIGRPFEQFSLGGMNDASNLDGHSYTYIGSQPGRIVQTLVRAKCNNPIMFFDELDKLTQSHGGQEISNLLLHITDFTQNNTFVDKFLPEINIDLSNVSFFFSANDMSSVNNILKNRMFIIDVSGYSIADKLNICNNHIIPNCLSDFNLHNIVFTETAIKYVISLSSDQGVRYIQHIFHDICSKISFILNAGNNVLDILPKNSLITFPIKFPLTIDHETVKYFITLKVYHPTYYI